ncbi:MAG TPA: hypothetical protein GX700_15065, partial [Paracoccus sp.]|nr:hypothetical protein [Paracoccus sp. (in: a-proteobacteria)]
MPAGSDVPVSQGRPGPAPAAKSADTKAGGGKPAVAKPVEAKPAAAPSAASKPATPAATKSTPKSAPVAFSSRRSAPVAPGPADTKRSGPVSDVASPRPGARKPEPPADRPSEGPSRLRRVYRRSRRAAKSALVRIGLAEAPKGRGKRREERQKAKDLQKPLVPASAPPASEREKASEEAAMTIFGARNMERSDTGFARRGLMLTGGLLLLLAAVAIWALYFTGGSGREADVAQAPQGETASLPPIDAPAQAPGPERTGAEITAPAPIAVPPAEIAEDAPADEIAATDEEATGTEAGVEADAEAPAPTTDPDALLEELVQEALTETLPADLLQPGEDAGPLGEDAPTLAPGAADEGAPGATESSQVIPETGEPDQRLALPPVLERPQLAEVAPVSPPPPPPFGAEFELGPDGLVEATPEGALTPSGVTVYAAPPAAVPPVRPAGIAPAEAIPDAAPAAEPGAAEPEAQLLAPEATPATASAVAEALAEALDDTAQTLGETAAVIAADPALAGIRPQPRSPRVAELAAQAAAEA